MRRRAHSTLDDRLAALARAADLADGRLEAGAVARARAVAERAGARVGLGVGTTVAALAGPTGAGKSSLFNALAGAELSSPGVRRPTTSTTTAAVRGEVEPALLDWLGARTRHHLGDGPSLVLLDLPDFDSVEAANRAEADRVLELADLAVWVTDPQKYADGALHDGQLRPRAAHREVMVVVLNQADRLAPDAVARVREDLGRLLQADGLGGVPVLAVSAVRGDGLAGLRALLDERTAARTAATDRLAGDVRAAAEALWAATGGRDELGRRDVVTPAARARLDAALADAAGVPVITAAVDRAHRRQGALAAGWPVLRWVRRLRPDPLGRLRLGDGDVRSSLPRATAVQGSQVGSALRMLAAEAADGLDGPWPALVRRAATAQEDALPEALDRAVTATALPDRRPRWWVVAGLLQRALALAALAGLLWLAVIAALGFLELQSVVPTPDWRDVPVPTLLLLGGLLLGLVLAVLARRLNAGGGRRRARRARKALEAAVGEVAEARVVEPVRRELAERQALHEALVVASGR